jgi:hypothetical protein
MLGLVGAKADGWLPSHSRLQPGGLRSGNRIIDEAAEAAGRRPGEIRRLLNISPDLANVESLLPLALEDGVSGLILSTDDARSIDVWGREIAPALREAVETERSG